MAWTASPSAEDDLFVISDYIAEHNKLASDRWVARISEIFNRLAEMPGVGVARPDLSPDLRLFPFGKYVVLYRQVGPDVEIVRVLHGARDWQTLL